MEVVRKPKELSAKDKMKANVAKNCLIVTLMSLDIGYGSILERHQRECNSTPPELNSVTLTDEELLTHMNESAERSDQTPAAPAAMPPPTMLARPPTMKTAVVKDANLKMTEVSVNNSLAVGLRIGHDPTSALCQCNLSLWNSMLLMRWDNRKYQTISSNLLKL